MLSVFQFITKSLKTSGAMIFLVAFILVIVAVQGKPPLELVAADYAKNLSTYGVEADCCKRMVYQVRSCGGHVMLLLDVEGRQLVRFMTGSNSNSASSVKIYSPYTFKKVPTPAILKCGEYRWFWMSWDVGRIKYGIGRVAGENAIIDVEDSTGTQVKKLAIQKGTYQPVTVRFGESEIERFARVLQDGKFSGDMILETPASLSNCASLCIELEDCGMFSYNQGLGLCANFYRMTSTFDMTSEEGWLSWKLLYCYP